MTNPSRRLFLKRIGSTAAASAPVLLSACATRSAGRAGKPAAATAALSEVRVRLQASADPLVERTFAILQDRVAERGGARVRRVDSQPHLILEVDRREPAEGYRIDTARGAVRVAGGSPRGLLYGVGRLLRTSRYGEGFTPSAWRGASAPRGALRGMYFASHFHNWYHQATEAETLRYIEDLALWGVNALWTAFPAMNLRGWDDPEAGPAVDMLRKHARAARAVGLRYATSINNTWFSGTPAAVRATPLPDPTGRRGNHGFPVCPSLPGGREFILANAGRLLEHLADPGVDLLVHWPYDEGGCACERCSPWGSRGYLRLARDLTALARHHFPGLQSVLSTWMFDTPPEGEWAGLTEALARDPDGVDYILADAHEDFPRYPLDVGVPGGRPLLNFPEISMWGNWPWGGVGANPLPGRFQRLWNQVRHVVQGGFPYSEGIYEDLNKAVVLQFYWDPDRPARETVREYAEYEFGHEAAPEALPLIDLLEAAASESFRKRPVPPEGVRQALRHAESMEARMPDWARRNWRWEIVRLRAVLDHERFAGGGLETPVAEGALLRLMEIYHSQLETDDPYHHRVRPPLRRAVSRRGNH